jgi:hypothetical protein
MAETNDFVVRLDGFKLTAEAKAQIAADIQGSVMKRLGGFDTGGDRYAHCPIDPKWKWCGIVVWKDPRGPIDPRSMPIATVEFK